ncbi:hypothetical protein CEUSTIGMA_g8720.t1 [Chlamydomonas eustigma]|uniref:Fucosyltransferase n=1 Tax=Chlamydomonas eustigma TaxID=1157962 RepID=A0A250XDY0_9CHLO|nr:hypothetical protein CEUSTIGMA_g8720.t1 [Chlamydomonas eustigma]|eukprot:GAX81288.1 hypothetical protein CEUSTIGMA_g8720.t1 [Chlamydomonas eustigma]
MTAHYFGRNFDYDSLTAPSGPCMLHGIKLNCRREDSQVHAATADALWFHIPHTRRLPNRTQPNQLLIGMSMESAAYYPRLDNESFLRRLDIICSYKFTSDVVTHYYDRHYDTEHNNFLSPPLVPTSKKKNVVAYINRNCGAKNGRNDIAKELSQHFPLEGYGCLGSQERVNKTTVFSRSKFCIAMENSNMPWYVTEKVWHAFLAGCLPIYMGAPNFELDFMPHPKAAIIYNPETMTPQQLAERLKKLSEDDALYEEHMKWRGLQLSDLSPGFQRLVNLSRGPNAACKLCMKVAQLRYDKEKQSGAVARPS